MNKYYVYGHYFKDTCELFYIGKGCGKRIDSLENRSVKWNEATSGREWYSSVIKDNLTSSEALSLEAKLLFTTSNLVNSSLSSETKEINSDILQRFYYCETSPTGARYAYDVVGTNGRTYKKAGEPAGKKDGTVTDKRGPRWTLNIDGTKWYMHRIIYAMFNDLSSENVIDHIDGNALNNKIENLRQISQKLNTRNSSRTRISNTGVLGVTEVKRKRLTFTTFVATVYLETGKQKQKEFGSYKHGRDAALQMAIDWRNSEISKLNKSGAGYTDRHLSN